MTANNHGEPQTYTNSLCKSREHSRCSNVKNKLHTIRIRGHLGRRAVYFRLFVRILVCLTSDKRCYVTLHTIYHVWQLTKSPVLCSMGCLHLRGGGIICGTDRRTHRQHGVGSGKSEYLVIVIIDAIQNSHTSRKYPSRLYRRLQKE